MALALGPELVSHSAGNLSGAGLEAGLEAGLFGLFAVFIFWQGWFQFILCAHDGGLIGELKWHGGHLSVFHAKKEGEFYPQMEADGRRVKF